MIPNESGKTAAAEPWIARPAIRTSIECESAQTSEPAANSDQADHEHALLAEHVAEPADDRGGDRGGEQESGEDEGDRGRRGAQVLLDGGQGGGDHRLLEGEGKRRDDQHGERAAVVLAVGVEEGSVHLELLDRSREPAEDVLGLLALGFAQHREDLALLLGDDLPLLGEDLFALGREGDQDLAAVGLRRLARDDALALESREHARRCRGGHASRERHVTDGHLWLVGEGDDELELGEA